MGSDAENPFVIPPHTTMGAVHLIVKDLQKATRFYRDTLGFRVQVLTGNSRALSADGIHALLVIEGRLEAPTRPAHASGLFHVALRVPTRRDLALLLKKMATAGSRPRGAADHYVSEALYLSDPEGNGLEFYADRTPDTWRQARERFAEPPQPLDVESLLRELDGDESGSGLATGTVIGHVHLRVADLDKAEAFYHGALGFERIAEIPDQARFVSAGGYHHHVAYNVWAGKGAPAAPAGAAGLKYFTIVLPDGKSMEEITERLRRHQLEVRQTAAGYLTFDPSHNGVLLTEPQRRV